MEAGAQLPQWVSADTTTALGQGCRGWGGQGSANPVTSYLGACDLREKEPFRSLGSAHHPTDAAQEGCDQARGSPGLHGRCGQCRAAGPGARGVGTLALTRRAPQNTIPLDPVFPVEVN